MFERFVIELVLSLFALSAKAHLRKVFHLPETGKTKITIDGVESIVCITKEMAESYSKLSVLESCNYQVVRDTPLEFVLLRKCADSNSITRMKRVSEAEVWTETEWVRRGKRSGNQIKQIYLGPC